MKYTLVASLMLMGMASCTKMNDCYRCITVAQTYTYGSSERNMDTSFTLNSKEMCNVTRDMVLDYITENSDTITQTRRLSNGNEIDENYATIGSCERFFKKN